MLKKLRLFWVVIFVSISYSEAAETLAERWGRLDLRPEKLFYAPQSPVEVEFLNVGRALAWKAYGKTSRPTDLKFQGYILFADPFHSGLQRISFLLGTDCSNFVQRLFQLLGAEFLYLKTRHWIELAKQQNAGIPLAPTKRPADVSRCAWESASRLFTRVELKTDLLQVGDVLIFAKATGPFGEHGHMGVVSSVTPLRLLQAKSKVGIVDLPISLAELPADSFVFRWRGDLTPMHAKSIEESLLTQYPSEPAICPGGL